MPTLTLDKERTLRFNWKAIKLLKNEYGINLLHLGEEQWQDPDVVSRVIWAGLIHEDPELSIDTVDEHLDVGMLGTVSETIARAMQGDLNPPTLAGADQSSTGPRPPSAKISTPPASSPGSSSDVGTIRQVS